MQLFLNHKGSSIFLSIYFFWWLFMIYDLSNEALSTAPVCDPSPIVFIFLTLLFGVVYSTVLGIKYLQKKGQTKSDHLIFLALVNLPIFPWLLYILSTA